MNWDHKLFFKINNLAGKNKKLDIISVFGGKYLLFLMILALPFIYIYDSFPKLGYFFVFIQFWLPAWLLSLIIGFIVKRPRPYIFYKNQIRPLFFPLFESWKSFPSDHALTCGVLTVLAILTGSILIGFIYIILSVWVCWGRIY